MSQGKTTILVPLKTKEDEVLEFDVADLSNNEMCEQVRMILTNEDGDISVWIEFAVFIFNPVGVPQAGSL